MPLITQECHNTSFHEVLERLAPNPMEHCTLSVELQPIIKVALPCNSARQVTVHSETCAMQATVNPCLAYCPEGHSSRSMQPFCALGS